MISSVLYSQIPDSLIYRLPENVIQIKLSDLENDTLNIDSLHAYTKTIRFRIGNVWLKKGIHYLPLSDSRYLLKKNLFQPVDSLKIIYRKQVFVFPEFTPPIMLSNQGNDTSFKDSIKKVALLSRFESAFSQEIQGLEKNGTFIRGFQIGSNQNLTLNSSLNLYMKGKISQQVHITAALTDENTPLQPEGNTQRLNEVDKVFIHIRAPYISGTIGDFDFKSGYSRFERINRKLQGVWASSESPAGSFEGIFSTTRGNTHQNIFLGQEGNQGPYVLSGRNGEKDIIILAGTERVYVNGLLKKRGENLDYIIDYTTGEIIFTQNILISSDMRIEVDFEYLDARQRYLKNFYMARWSKSYKNIKPYISFYQEKDDINNVLVDSSPLDQNEREILKAAGNNQAKAYRDGWALVEKGQGFYVLLDTVINDTTIQYFKYNRDSGEYVVNFSFVGVNQGNYQRERLGVYTFVGIDNGDYDPVIRIPLPEKKQLFGFGVMIGDSSKNYFNNQISFSNYDKNFVSGMDDGNNWGKALHLSGKIKKPVVLTKKALNIEVGGYLDYKDSTFSPLDRYYQADYLKYWNLNTVGSGAEKKSELFTKLTFQGMTYHNRLGILDLGNGNTTTKIGHQFDMKLKKFYDRFSIDYTKLSNEAIANYYRKLMNTFGVTPSEKLQVYQIFQHELRENNEAGLISGFETSQLSLGNDWVQSSNFSIKARGDYKQDFLFDPTSQGKKQKQADIFQYYTELNVAKSGKLNSSLIFNFREKDYDPFFENFQGDKINTFLINPLLQDTSWLDRKSYSAKFSFNLRSFDRQLINSIDYQIASELTPIKEKVYIKVDNQLGNYRFDEELNEYVPDPNGDYILFIAPGQSYIPTSNVYVLYQLSWRPTGRRGRRGGKNKKFSWFTLNNRIKIEEKTRHDRLRDLYLLNLSKFQQPGKTIRGTLLSQNELTLFPYHPMWNIFIRNRYQKQLINIYLNENDNEQRIISDQSVVLRYRRSSKWKMELELSQKTTARAVPSEPSRDRDISSYGIGLRTTSALFSKLDNQFDVYVFKEEDSRLAGLLQSHYFKIKNRSTLNLWKKSRLLAAINYIKVVIDKNRNNLVFPFEMAEGKKPGDNLDWTFRFDYIVSNFLTFSVDYRGRKDAIFKKTIHTGQMELRAYF
ncbi:MAG: hypothetical protein Kow00108_10270 [Calditrichia bacterium]